MGGAGNMQSIGVGIGWNSNHQVAAALRRLLTLVDRLDIDLLHTDGMQATDAEWVLERCARQRSRPFFLAVGDAYAEQAMRRYYHHTAVQGRLMNHAIALACEQYGLAPFVVGFLLSTFGFDKNIDPAADQSSSAVFAIYLGFVAIPVACQAVAIALLKFYRLSEEELLGTATREGATA